MTEDLKDSGSGVSVIWKRTQRLLEYLERPVVAASVLALGDSLGLFVSLGSIPKPTLVLILFLEGGIGLILGVGIALSATPSAAKLGEMLLGSAPWSRGGEKHAEGVGWRWLVASSLLILIGFGISLA